MLKEYSIAEIAEKVAGTVQGDSSLLIKGLCALNEPKESALTFSTAKTQTALKKALADYQHSAVLIKQGLNRPEDSSATCIVVKDPHRALLTLIPLFREKLEVPRVISPKAEVAESTKIGKNVAIGAFSVIGEDCIIEDDVTIHPHVVIYRGAHIGKGSVIHAAAIIREFCIIEKGVIIQNGAVIGADGFGYIPNQDGSLYPVPQIGIAHLEDDVEIGANSCVDRAALGTTRIGQGTKIDNQVQIGHNTTIGKHSIVCGQGGIAGSAQIGDHVMLGARIGVTDHAKIVSGCRFAASTNVYQSILTPGDYAGSPAMPIMEFRRGMNITKKLPSLLSSIKKQQKGSNENQ